MENPSTRHICFVAKPKRKNELDLLIGVESDPLIIKNEDQTVIEVPAPAGGWTHEELERYQEVDIDTDGMSLALEAYIGERWIGSTEV